MCSPASSRFGLGRSRLSSCLCREVYGTSGKRLMRSEPGHLTYLSSHLFDRYGVFIFVILGPLLSPLLGSLIVDESTRRWDEPASTGVMAGTGWRPDSTDSRSYALGRPWSGASIVVS